MMRERKGAFFCAIFAAGLLLLTSSITAAVAERRVALVIGNSAYQNVPQLPNPARDARAVTDLLKRAGFDSVTMALDLKYLNFTRAIRRFEDAAIGADIAVLYFAGHGIEIGGTNYLIPVNARLASDRDARDEAVPLDRLVRSAEPARRLRLVILDACRDNPFAKSMKRHRRAALRSLGGGLVEVAPASSDTLIAYASKAGSIAEDGAGEHSPFTAALIKHLAVPGLDIRLAFGRVRDEVLKRTNNQQEPFVYGSLGGSNISLMPSQAVPPEPSLAEARSDYELVERIGTRKAWEVFLGIYKNGVFANLAREQLLKLEAAETENRQQSPAPASPAKETRVIGLDPRPRAAKDVEPRVQEETEQRHAPEREGTTRKSGPAARHEAALERTGPEQGVRSFADLACQREKELLAVLKSYGNKGWVRADLHRLHKQLRCERLRRDVVAALDSLAMPQQPPQLPAAAANTPALVLAAQQQLGRIGCFDGMEDGKLGPLTRAGLKRYLMERGRAADHIDITEELVASLTEEKGQVCPLVCADGEVARADRCVARLPPRTGAGIGF